MKNTLFILLTLLTVSCSGNPVITNNKPQTINGFEVIPQYPNSYEHFIQCTWHYYGGQQNDC